MSDVQLLTVKDATKRLAVSSSFLYRLISSGQITYIQMGQGAVRFSERDLEAYVDKQRRVREERICHE